MLHPSQSRSYGLSNSKSSQTTQEILCDDPRLKNIKKKIHTHPHTNQTNTNTKPNTHKNTPTYPPPHTHTTKNTKTKQNKNNLNRKKMDTQVQGSIRCAVKEKSSEKLYYDVNKDIPEDKD